MTTHHHQIWLLADELRGQPRGIEALSLLKACRKAGIKPSLDELAHIVERYHPHAEFFVPIPVADFISELLRKRQPRSILDPWAGMGVLPIRLAENLSPDRFDAYCLNLDLMEIIGQIEGSDALTIRGEDALKALESETATYDAVATCPPWGLRTKQAVVMELDGKQIEVKDDYGHLLVLESCRHLANDGVLVFVASSSFFQGPERRGNSRHTLGKMGIRPTIAIELPAGTFAPLTNMTTHIVLLERTDRTELFTGRLSGDMEQQQKLLENAKAFADGDRPESGRMVDATSFVGFTPVELAERLRTTAKRMGFVDYPFSHVFSKCILHSKGFGGFLPDGDAVYLPSMGQTAATTDPSRLPERLKRFFQLNVNSDVANAEFAAGWLNSSFGQLWRDSIRSGETMPTISKANLESSKIFLPPAKVRSRQDEVVLCQAHLARLKNEISELESQLWDRPLAVAKVVDAVKTINREDRYVDWLDTLPFPLASILWSCETQSDGPKARYERKIHFFEALAEFLGIVLLSACIKNESVWNQEQVSLKKTLDSEGLTLERATFGTWVTIAGALSKAIRVLLNDAEEVVFGLFQTRNRNVLHAVLSKDLVSVLQRVNKIRNDWQGHTGIVSPRDAERVDRKLAEFINDVRRVFGVVWEHYQLLLPGDCRVRNGQFEYQTKLIMGTRTPFPSESIFVTEAFEDGRLHLKDPGETVGLKLLPLVKVLSSPKSEENACYFYNRCEHNGHRFLSYYFEAESEIVRDFSDVTEALGSLWLSEEGIP